MLLTLKKMIQTIEKKNVEEEKMTKSEVQKNALVEKINKVKIGIFQIMERCFYPIDAKIFL